MTIRKIVKTIDAAFRDGARARRVQPTAQFRKDVQKDRRGTLRKFETVEHALEDRAKIEKSRTAKPNGKSDAKARAKAKKK